jgi:methyl-accepting chemotaxis protein
MSESTIAIDESGTKFSPDTSRPTRPTAKYRRRRFLIDKRRQLKTALLTSSLAFFLLAVVNIAFQFLRTSQTMVLTSVAPQLEPVLKKQDAEFGALLLVISLVFVLGVFAITIFRTHLTAGAVFAVKRTIGQVRKGDMNSTLKLRARDNLQDLVQPFNEMVGSLRERAIADADALDGLADRAASGAATTEELAAALRRLADEKRELGA